MGALIVKTLGLDIGTNSVGSAWVDADAMQVCLGASVFPAGVEDSQHGRGDPKNHARRTARSQRVSIRRRSDRRRDLRRRLQQWGWMPRGEPALGAWMNLNPWHLRRDGLTKPLTGEQFGRVLLHLAQRRGPSWFDDDETQEPAGSEDGKARPARRNPDKPQTLKQANQKLADMLEGRTVGQFMADLYDRQRPLGKPIRNRNDPEGSPRYDYFPNRQMLREEFEKLWAAQRAMGGELAALLTDQRKRELYNPTGTDVWKCQGLLWGQRNTYWDPGTLGRCDLEPTDRVCPKADMYAQEFLVLQDVNNIRIHWEGESPAPLIPEDRAKVLDVLSRQKTATPKTIRAALGLSRRDVRDLVSLNIEQDGTKRLNTNWFVREIVGALGPDAWSAMPDKTRQAINMAICKFDPREPADVEKLSAGAAKWWGLSSAQAAAFVAAWQSRPSPESRIKLSRQAVRLLLPYLRKGDTVTEARRRFSNDADSAATDEQRRRYRLGGYQASHAVRHFLAKHADQLPPAPMMANPVVRKAIHEVRRHVSAYLRKFGCKPDRVIVELAREARLSGAQADRIAADNRRRRDERLAIAQDPELARKFASMRRGQMEQAIERVLLCRAQRGICAYGSLDTNQGRTITEPQALEGVGLEVDHLIPRSRGGSNGRGNKVLCYAATNRGKGNRTPMEWLGKDSNEFKEFVRRFRHWQEGAPEDRLRWNNLHREALSMDAYLQSQLTDTAYAARQVVQWLDQVLYGDAPSDGEPRRRVFATNGRYTALLRRHWGLFFDEHDPEPQGKSRADHRHHAIDATIIACSGPERIGQIAAAWQAQEAEMAEGRSRSSFTIEPPWGQPDEFRRQVLEQVAALRVAHRPEGRKILGPFHMETMYGPILGTDGRLTEQFTKRIALARLTPNHLRVPPGWEELRAAFDQATTPAGQRAIRRQMLALPDVPAGKSGVLRDPWCREELRRSLRAGGLDPDNFSPPQLKNLIRAGKLTLADGQVPRGVTLRMVFNNVVAVPRRLPGSRQRDPDPRSMRVYEGQSNHHIEIRQTPRGKWVGQVVTTHEAAQRVRPPKPGGQTKRPAVDRADNETGSFVMSLAVGETVHMAHPETAKEGYFVVFKLDNSEPAAIHLTPHWDAGRSAPDERFRQREDIRRSASQLQQCRVGAKAPEKVWISPLGDVKVLIRD